MRPSPTTSANSVDLELLAVSYGNLNSMLGMNVLASGGVSMMLWREGANWILIWFAFSIVLTVVRLVLCANLTHAVILNATAEQSQRWRRQFGFGLYASTASWAVMSLFVGQWHTADHYILALILSALAAGGSGIMASMLREGRIYIAAMLGSASVLLFNYDQQGLIMTLLGLIFIAVMTYVHNRNYIALRHSIALRNENGNLIRDLKVLNANLEQRVEERTQALVDAANSDALTGLPNRRRLMSWMQTHLRPDDSREAAVLFLDLDRFKQINDALGHKIGDSILQAVVGRLKTLVPEGAMLARWGGDEFVVVFGQGSATSADAEGIANAMIETVSAPFGIDGQRLSLGLSIGLAVYPADASTHEALILAADLAVTEVKRKGRGKVFLFCEAYAATQKRRFDVSRALAEATKDDQLVLHYQPIFNARTGTIYGYEALARWNHPVLGSVSPNEFIPIAEESDGIIELGDMVLRRACADAMAWTTPTDAPIVAVNVSVKQLCEPDFALCVAQILAKTGLPAGRLELEVTESIFSDDYISATRSSLNSLRAIGVSLSIDDFGTGYSSLSRLLNLPVTAVKIDRSFVSTLSGNGGALVESALLIARRLGIAVIAEGVETEEQFEKLSAMGVEIFQGYYFGKPSPDPVKNHDMKSYAAISRIDSRFGSRLPTSVEYDPICGSIAHGYGSLFHQFGTGRSPPASTIGLSRA